MIDINDGSWIKSFLSKADEVREREAINALKDGLRRCSNGHAYLFPHITYPDAGGIVDAGVVGKYEIRPLVLCPVCSVCL